MVAEGEQGANGLGLVGAAGQLDRALEVLARLLRVADPPEDAAEDPVRAARRRGLAEPLGQPQRLLGGVDGEHVVAGVHVEGGRLLVEADQLDARRAVLEQVDALLVVVDRGLALALVPVGGADLAVQVADPGQVLLAAVEVEAALPDLDRLVDAPDPERDVAHLLPDPGPRRLVDGAVEADRAAVVAERLLVRVELGGGVAGRLEEVERLVGHRAQLARLDPRLGAEAGGAPVVLGDRGDGDLAALPGALLDEARRRRSAGGSGTPSAASRRRRRGSARA